MIVVVEVALLPTLTLILGLLLAGPPLRRDRGSAP